MMLSNGKDKQSGGLLVLTQPASLLALPTMREPTDPARHERRESRKTSPPKLVI